MSRREEIEAKRLRLQELRRQREEKDRLSRNSLPINLNNDHEQLKKHQLVDDLVNSLVGDGEVANTAAVTAAPVQEESTRRSIHRSIAVQTTEIVPKSNQVLTYNKSTQTIDYEALAKEEQQNVRRHAIEDNVNFEIEEHTPTKEEEDQEELESVAEVAEVDEHLLSSFLQDSLKIIDRVIDEDKDILQRYTNLKKQAMEEEQSHVLLQALKFDHGIYSLDTSPFIPDLVAISTGNNIYIYNIKFNQYEKQYKSATKILNVQFSKFQANHIIGTGFNGKVQVWDFESYSKFPILESAVSLDTHAYPVWCLNQLNENNGVVITSSTDGRIMTWDPRILSKPMSEPIELKIPKSLNLRYDELTPLVTTNLHNELGFMIIGAEDGNIYKIKRFDNKVDGNPEKIIETIFQAHTGPITAVSPSIKFPNLFISCAFDWKVYLWDSKNDEGPILQIYKSEAVMDCSWRNEHPTQIGYIFENVFELLDLSIDTVTPIVKIITENTLNKLKFDKEGKNVVLGSIKGEVLIYELITDEFKSEIGKLIKLSKG